MQGFGRVKILEALIFNSLSKESLTRAGLAGCPVFCNGTEYQILELIPAWIMFLWKYILRRALVSGIIVRVLTCSDQIRLWIFYGKPQRIMHGHQLMDQLI